ncbi:hypothetical protein M9H77_07972 [Catharanthus roseus]|uniref:Uncharacterized protein n=1 Tax=Catharanthus roseus TaxID=4058 RepID=A0ACC0BWP9_CATRO|nr:hypothetical protein M9H77_07972 [Catharanthus roseus]
MPSDQWRLRVRDGPAVAAEALSYPSNEYIRWYRGITRVYIGNPVNRDTRLHRYLPAGVDRRMMEVDDMTLVVIQEPPSSPLQMALFAKKHHILRPTGFLGFGHPFLRAQPVHIHCISLYRRHLNLMKRSGRMTWMVYSVTDSGIMSVKS